MKKMILLFLVIIPLLIVTLGLISMSKGNIEDIIICTTNDNSHYIPSNVCEYYLRNYRLTQEDINYLESRAGIAFLFDISDKAQRNELLWLFISKGVSINMPSGIDGYPPLHAAIINNEPKLVEFLLKNGADPNQKDKNNNLTADEFVEFLIRTKPSVDRSSITALLTTSNVKSHNNANSLGQ